MVFPFRRKKFKIDCQDSCCGGHLGFPTRTTLAIFDLQVTQILRIKLQVRWHFGSGNEVQNRISRWRPYLIFNQKYFSYFQYEIILASEFQSQNLASRIKREIQYRFSRWRLSQPSCILIETISAVFDLHIAPILATKFWANWPICSAEEIQNTFSRSEWLNLREDVCKHARLFFSSADVTGDVQNRFSRWHGHGGQLWFLIRTIKAFCFAFFFFFICKSQWYP